MRKFFLLFFMAILATPALLANEVYFYFQDGEEDDFELMAPQTLVSIWNETDEEPVAVPEDMAFMSYQFEGAKILRISPSDFDYELTVSVDGDSDTYFLDQEETEWYLTLLPEADGLEVYVRVYLAGQAPGGGGANDVEIAFNIQKAEGSQIDNPGEYVSISYFDINLFQTVDVTISENYGSATVAPGATFEITPAEGYKVTDVMTYLPGVATVSAPGDDDNIWRVAVSYEPEGYFAAFFVTVDKESGEPSENPDQATITQIEKLQWKVEWPAYDFISQTDTDYFDNNAYITDSKGTKTTLYSNLHGDHEDAEIIFPDSGNYFTVNLGKLKLAEGKYVLTLPEGYVELGRERLPSEEQNLDLEVGKTPDVTYTVEISDLEGNIFDISWDNVTLLTPADTEGAYLRNVMTNEEYPMLYLVDDLYSKCNVRIYNGDKLRVNLTNNYPDLSTGLYEFYLPAGYVKFNGTETTNEAIDGHMVSYVKSWSEGEIAFNALTEENKLTLTWEDATDIAFNTEYEGDQLIHGLTIFDEENAYDLEYNTDFTISGNVLTVDLSELQLKAGECSLVVPEGSLLITVDGITDYTDGCRFTFEYGNKEQPDKPQFYTGEATWKKVSGSMLEVSWEGHSLSMVEDAEKCSVHNFETGIIYLDYGTDVTLSDDKTRLQIRLNSLPDSYEYRVNVPEACLYIHVDDASLLNQATSLDGVTSAVEGVEAASRYRVTNINGIVVLDTDNAAALGKLPRGIYIINGKKVMK